MIEGLRGRLPRTSTCRSGKPLKLKFIRVLIKNVTFTYKGEGGRLELERRVPLHLYT